MSNSLYRGWPPLSKENAARVIELVRPSDRHDDCLLEAAISVQWIKRKTAAIRTPKQRKDALLNVAEKIAAVIESIEDLPIATQSELDPKLLRRTLSKKQVLLFPELEVVTQPGTLHQLHDRTLALAKNIVVKRKAGGKRTGPGNVIDAAKKKAAADSALVLLQYGSRKPTLYPGGPYYELTALLFKLATGKKEVFDVRRACELRLHAKATTRDAEIWVMMPEDDKVFEDND